MQNKGLWHAAHPELNKWKIKPSQTEKLRKIDIIILLSDYLDYHMKRETNEPQMTMEKEI